MRDGPSFDLRDGVELAGVGPDDLWWRYLALGGTADPALLAARISRQAACSAMEHDLIAQAINECFMDGGLRTFPVGYVLGPPPDVRRSSDGWRRGGTSDAHATAVDARRRSAAAADRAARMHELAARLMLASGRPDLAARAGQRADRAAARATHARRDRP